MNDSLLRLYHRLPDQARTITASLRGLYLKNQRYSKETDQLAAAAVEREQWTVDRWRSWQQEALARILRRAATQVPFYRSQWTERRRRGDMSSFEVLDNWPVLSKDSVRDNPRAFVAEDCDPKRLIAEHTSGTTGKPVTLFFGRQAVKEWYALAEARWRGWYGLSRRDRWAILGGQLVAPASQNRPPFWVWNAGLNQLYLSSYHLAPENIKSYLDAMVSYGVSYLLGYPSAIYSLARFAIDQGLDTPQLRVVISNAEPLYDHQRELIARAFRCPVKDTYGMSEAICAASECDAGSLHLWPEVGLLEVLEHDQDNRAVDGDVGRLVCTGLLNPDMPLIRYELGDRGALASAEIKCACGRTLPILDRVEGRLDDVLITRDGRRIGRLDPVFKTDVPIRAAQIVQESLDDIRLRVVPAPGYTTEHGRILSSRLRDRVGDMNIVVEQVSEISRTNNGKFRAVISQLHRDQLRSNLN